MYRPWKKALIVNNMAVIAGGYYSQVYWSQTDDFKVSMVDEHDADVIIWETVERLRGKI